MNGSLNGRQPAVFIRFLPGSKLTLLTDTVKSRIRFEMEWQCGLYEHRRRGTKLCPAMPLLETAIVHNDLNDKSDSLSVDPSHIQEQLLIKTVQIDRKKGLYTS